MEQYRHGDLLIIPVDALPAGLKKKKDLILAAGEVTGHHHRLSNTAVVLENATELYFEAKKETTLTHEEHGPLVFKPGNYRVIRQREFSPEYGERRVAD